MSAIKRGIYDISPSGKIDSSRCDKSVKYRSIEIRSIRGQRGNEWLDKITNYANEFEFH